MSDPTIEELSEEGAANLKENFLKRGKLFYNVDFTSFTTTNFNSKLVIRNPIASLINLIIFRVSVSLVLGVTTSQLNYINMRIRKNPTFSSLGTLLTSHNLTINDTGPIQAEIYELPTTTDTGTIVQRVMGINADAKSEPMILKPGQDLLIQIQVNDFNNDVYIRTVFAEEVV